MILSADIILLCSIIFVGGVSGLGDSDDYLRLGRRARIIDALWLYVVPAFVTSFRILLVSEAVAGEDWQED